MLSWSLSWCICLWQGSSFIIKSLRSEKTSKITSQTLNSALNLIPNKIHMPFCLLLLLLLLLSVLLLLKYFCQGVMLCVCTQGSAHLPARWVSAALPHWWCTHRHSPKHPPLALGHLSVWVLLTQPGPGVQEQQSHANTSGVSSRRQIGNHLGEQIHTLSLIASLSAFNCNELSGSAQQGAETLGWNLCNSCKCLHKSQVNVKLPTDSNIHEALFVFSLGDWGSKAAHMAVHWSRECVCLCIHMHRSLVALQTEFSGGCGSSG